MRVIGRPKGSFAAEPRDHDRILAIVRLRDQENMRWRQIGEILGISHMAPYLLYQQWRDWAYENYAFIVIFTPHGLESNAAA
jgi:hypothetical protein